MGASIPVMCSGSFLPIRDSPFSQDYIKEGLGLTYEKVQCEFCNSTFLFSQNAIKCPNCGASYSDKCKFAYNKANVRCSG